MRVIWMLALLGIVACADTVGPPFTAVKLVPALSLFSESTRPDTVMRQRRMVARLVNATTTLPVSQQLVHFRVVEGGGSLYVPSGITNATGEFRQAWTLGPRAGKQVLEAYWIDQTTGEPLATRDTVVALPDTVISFAVDTAPVSLLVGERYALGRRVSGQPTDRHGNVVDVPVVYAFPAPWSAIADTVWSMVPTRGRATVSVGTLVRTIPILAYKHQLAGGSFDVSWMCTYQGGNVQRSDGSVASGLRDSAIYSMRTDSIVYKAGVSDSTIAKVYLGGSIERRWSDGFTEWYSNVRFAWPIRREATDTIWWGSYQGRQLDYGRAVRTANGWAGGLFCSDSRVAYSEAVLVSK